MRKGGRKEENNPAIAPRLDTDGRSGGCHHVWGHRGLINEVINKWLFL